LSKFLSYVALATYPALSMFVYDWFGPGSRWAFKNKRPVLPPDLATLEEERGRRLLPAKYVLLFLAVYGLVHRNIWRLAPVHASARRWPVLLCVGLLGGAAIFGFRRAASVLSPSLAARESGDDLLRGPSALWLTIFITAAFPEELWRAVCVTGLRQNGYSALAAAALSAFCFSLAHAGGLPPRIPPGFQIAVAEMAVGIALGAIFIWSGNVVTPCLASVAFYTANFFWMRRRYGSPIPEDGTAGEGNT
jgi:membrane protease YdiL (CAAX protease family)